MRPTNSAKLALEELNARINPSTLLYSFGTVFYVADASETNDVAITGGSGSVSITDTGVSSINVDSSAIPYVTGSGNSLTLTGTIGAVYVYAGNLNDTIDGSGFSSSGYLFLDGQGGNDSVTGSSSGDQLYGGDGDDTVHGGAGNDYIDGRWSDTGIATDGSDMLYNEVVRDKPAERRWATGRKLEVVG